MEQLTIFDYLASQKNIKPPKFDFMSDNWHLCMEEKPAADGVYFTFLIFEEAYIYGYKAYSGGEWWYWRDGTWNKKCKFDVVGWTEISAEMKKTDSCLPERLTLKGII